MKYKKNLVALIFSGMLCFSCSGNTSVTSNDVISTPKTQNDPNEGWEVDFSVMDTNKANDDLFNVDNVKEHNSPLKGKTFYWLGSSVTYGATSDGEAVPEYLAKSTGSFYKKDAVSGTTLFTAGNSRTSYTYRLKNSKEFDPNANIDGFVCQISTNDALSNNLSHRGKITADDVIYSENFDLSTTIGGIEFIINYVKETWDCPIYFYSGSFFQDSGSSRVSTNPSGTNYAKLIDEVKQVEEKYDKLDDFNVNVIDLFNDKTFNAKVSDTYYKWAMNDPVHPKKDGYRQWWTPYIESCLINYCTEII